MPRHPSLTAPLLCALALLVSGCASLSARRDACAFTLREAEARLRAAPVITAPGVRRYDLGGILLTLSHTPAGRVIHVHAGSHMIGPLASAAVDSLVPRGRRGRLLRRDGSSEGACTQRVEEWYRCLTVKRWQENCRGASPGGMEMKWVDPAG